MLANKIFLFIKSKIENGVASNILLFVGASLSILWSFHFSRVTISMPYQFEFREGAAQVLTSFLLNGENPYDFINQPLGLNNYGLGYNVVVLPFAALFGNTLRVHRMVSVLFSFSSALIGAWAVYKARRSFSLALLCGAFVLVGFIGQGGIGSSPSSMGTFLFIIAVFSPFPRSFDNASLILSVLFSIMVFYTKAYFILAFGIVAFYLFLFISKKKGAIYTLLFLMLMVISFVAMRLSFPLYFINTLAGNISYTSRSFENLYSQLIQLFYYFYPVLALTVIVLVADFIKKKKEPSDSKAADFFFNFSNWDQPLVRVAPNYFLYSFACVLLAFVFILGPHTGNYMNYAYQMLVPTFLFWFFQKFEFKKISGIFFALLILFNLFYWEKTLLNPRMLEQGNSVEWKKLYAYLEPSMNILNSPTITSKLVELGLKPADSGLTIYYYFIKPYPDNPWLGPPYDEFYNDGLEYTKFINDSIEKQKFDLIVTTKDVDVFYDVDLIAEYYSSTKQIVLYMPQTSQKWTVQIWHPLER